jgi:transcriptional regulator with XRE-family HTH domain
VLDFNKIKILASRKNMSVPQLAEMSGMDKQKLYPILKRGDCTVKTLEALSSALNVSPAYWWEEETAKAENQNSNNLNEPKMNYGETITRTHHEDVVHQLEQRLKEKDDQIDFLRHQIDCNFKSKTAG